MSETTRRALRDDGKGKKSGEPLFLYCEEHGLGYPPGHRSGRMVFFARWKHCLWKVRLETVAMHAASVDRGTGHPACQHGSMIVLDENPHSALLRHVVRAQESGAHERERLLFPFVVAVAPLERRDGDTRIIVLDRVELTWEDVEAVALELVYLKRGNPSAVRCIWVDRDEEAELAAWQRNQSSYIHELRKPLRERAELVPPSGVERRAESWKMPLEEAREHLREQGYSEDKQGNFIRKYPAFDEGERDQFAHLLFSYAKKRSYKGTIYLSAHAWPELEFVADGKRFQAKFKGERAWYGYFREDKLVVCIPVANRFDMRAYDEHTVPGDPDFFEAMDEVCRAESDEAKNAADALKEKGWTYEETPDGRNEPESEKPKT